MIAIQFGYLFFTSVVIYGWWKLDKWLCNRKKK